MPDLLLSPREQKALRALYACEVVPGRPIPTPEVLRLVDALIPGDILGSVLVDHQGHLLAQVMVPHRFYDDDDSAAEPGALRLGITHWSRQPAAAEACGTLPAGIADGVVIGFRNGVDAVAQLYIDRRKRMFDERDLAMLDLISPALFRLLRERPTSTLPPCLTVQERRVLVQVAAGLTNAEIAEMLFVAPSTVRKHLEHSYRKLGVSNRLAAVVAVRGTGIADPDLRERIERSS